MTNPPSIRWVHCGSHGRPHLLDADGSCWCGVVQGDPERKYGVTDLEAASRLDAEAECRRRGLWLYADREEAS